MPTARTARVRASLERLGLTPLEASVYEFLAREPASTGYRIAQALGKSVGMIYKAVESLEAKGAAMSADDGDSRVLRAVPVEDFVGRLRRGFEEACTTACRALADTPDIVPDDRLYRLSSREQAIQRVLSMLASATRFAIINATPDPARELAPAIRATTARGVRVGVKAFRSFDAPGADVRLDPRGVDAVASAPGEWLLATADGGDYLAALFEHDTGRLHAGYWTRNPLLAWSTFTGLSSDLALAGVRSAMAEGRDAEQLAGELRSLDAFSAPNSAGKLTLLDVYRRPTPARLRRAGADRSTER